MCLNFGTPKIIDFPLGVPILKHISVLLLRSSVELNVIFVPLFLSHNRLLSFFGWLVVLGLTAFETVFQSFLGHLPEGEGERREKNVQTTPTRIVGPPTIIQISRMPWH